ncbi:Microsomal glutathione S-transferase 1 [Habropoda laboriosa]|uniref:Microsomal glutathione S-transferase 1 n=1 Tax=Habropoda laboriosa TaxID=597456 RepID=A0A0L7QLJ0_9HYME|nr:PREDICTED: microsomal glutathione S-transferase 1-like [Habropoda laboriosa]KOC59381.1 Microsomal glutathione S-transferase 1 [Habropoda laboriosa]
MSTLNTSLIQPDLIKTFAFRGSILALKLVAVVGLTARYRMKKRIFINPDDAAFVKGAKIANNDPDIERVRRAHLNDLENIPLWFFVTFLWLTTGPAMWLATILIRTFVLARIVHTLAYAVVALPYRALSFFVGMGITIFQTISTLLYYI